MSSQSYVKIHIFTSCIDQITNRIPTSPAQKRALHQISPPYAPPLPPFPTRPGSPIPIGSCSEGPLTEEDHAPLCGEELTERRTSFAQHPATTADLLDAM